MGLTLAEKLIARAAGRDAVRPGETVTVRVDLAMMHDSGGPRRITPILERLGAKVWDADKIVLVSDHRVPAADPQSDDDADYFACHEFDADALEPQVAAPHSPACAGFGGGVLAGDEVCISSTSRNFQGRMGAQSAKVYLGSPYAVAGEIRDPREFLNGA